MDIRLEKPWNRFHIHNQYYGRVGAQRSRLRTADLTEIYEEALYENIFREEAEEQDFDSFYQDPFEFSSELEVRAGYKMLTGEEPTAPEQYTYYNAHIREVNECIVERCRVKKHREERRLQEKKEQRELYEAICEEFDRDLTDAIGNLLLGLEVATDER